MWTGSTELDRIERERTRATTRYLRDQVLTLPAIWLKDLVPFPAEHYELALDVPVRRAIATALVDQDLVLLVPTRHKGIGVVAHVDELKRPWSGDGGIELGVTGVRMSTQKGTRVMAAKGTSRATPLVPSLDIVSGRPSPPS